ncbi:MAG: DegT/DnrJ/EryC1/StrS family aminotransferase [Xanthomonadales bacterium]|nr:DegT/DnrJ/EryC1/StrS family aminotransferase [Xanthomonadales bacterium]
MLHIPLYQPDLSGNERAYLLEAFDSGWISSKGRFVAAFESAFAVQVGFAHAISVCNGTAALHLALLALGIGAGDEVLVPTLTYVATVNAIRHVGATPVFVDADAQTWQIDVADARRRISPRTRAALAVHLYGGSCDLHALRSLCLDHDLRLIEDCAEAIGNRFDGEHVGRGADAATFSFFGNKTLSTGEGGMVVCMDDTVADRVRRLRGQGLVPGHEYWHDIAGYNYRMTNLCAAIGLAQLERIATTLASKRRLDARYRSALAGSALRFQCHHDDDQPSHWMTSVLTPEPGQRDPLRAALAAAGIETRPLFSPVHLMPMYDGRRGAFPVAEDLSGRGLNLPSWPDLSESQVAHVTATILDHLEQQGCG